MNIFRSIAHMIRPARTTAPCVEEGVIQRVQVRHNQFDARSLNSMQLTGFASSTPVGTDVMTVNVSGDNSNGVVIASNHQSYRPKTLQTGDAMIYSCADPQQSVWLKSDGTIVITSTNEVIINAPLVTINGDLRVTGSVIGGYGGADQITLQGHTHHNPNDSHGDSIGPTTAPIAGT